MTRTEKYKELRESLKRESNDIKELLSLDNNTLDDCIFKVSISNSDSVDEFREETIHSLLDEIINNLNGIVV